LEVLENEILPLASIVALRQLDFLLNLNKWARKELVNPSELLVYPRNLQRLPHLPKHLQELKVQKMLIL